MESAKLKKIDAICRDRRNTAKEALSAIYKLIDGEIIGQIEGGGLNRMTVRADGGETIIGISWETYHREIVDFKLHVDTLNYDEDMEGNLKPSAWTRVDFIYGKGGIS